MCASIDDLGVQHSMEEANCSAPLNYAERYQQVLALDDNNFLCAQIDLSAMLAAGARIVVATTAGPDLPEIPGRRGRVQVQRDWLLQYPDGRVALFALGATPQDVPTWVPVLRVIRQGEAWMGLRLFRRASGRLRFGRSSSVSADGQEKVQLLAAPPSASPAAGGRATIASVWPVRTSRRRCVPTRIPHPGRSGDAHHEGHREVGGRATELRA